MAKWFIGIAIVSSAVIWAIPGGAADPKEKNGGLEDADVAAIIEYNTKIVQDSLAGQPKRAVRLRAATAARMIAATAQSGGAARNAELATKRDAALKIAEAIDAEKLVDARAAIKDFASLKADPNAQLGAVPIIDKKFKLDDVMNQFTRERTGGLEIEAKLEAWEDALPKEGLAEVVQTGNQLYSVFELVKGHQANAKFGTQAQWDKFADQALARAQELRDASRKGDRDATSKAVKAMNNSCMDCHKVFKPKVGG
jgi:cytochrome c556